jgi:hypothetical protein
MRQPVVAASPVLFADSTHQRPPVPAGAPPAAPPRARAFAVDRLDRIRAEPDLVLTAEEVEQHANPLRAAGQTSAA